MTFEEELRRSIETLTDRLRNEVASHLEATTRDLHDVVAAESRAAAAQAASEAREAAEREAAGRLTAAIADAEMRAREAGLAEGRESGMEEGRQTGFSEGREAGREEGRQTGFAEGREAGSEEGRQTGLAEGREAGLIEGREAGIAEGWESGREAGWTEGSKAGHDAGRQDGYEGGYTDGHEAGRQAGRQEGKEDSHEDSQATISRLAEAVRLIDRGGSLSEILDALTVSASHEASRVGLLLVQGEQLRGWRFVGFDPELTQSQDARLFELPLSDAGIIADAVRDQQCTVAEGADGGVAALPAFARFTTGSSGAPARHAQAVPVTLIGQVAAVLYSDQGDHDQPRGRSPAMLEILARHAARRLECVTALRSSQLLTHWPDALRSFSTPGRPDVEPMPGGGTEEPLGTESFYSEVVDRAADADAAQAARRYARLLISEIKLYHESDVLSGLQERDLAVRLGGEIARARGLYEERVPMHVRQGTDHFHAELVSTLANGDASLLGQRG